MSTIIFDLANEYLIADAAKLIAETYFKRLDPYIASTATTHLKSLSPSCWCSFSLWVRVSINLTTTGFRSASHLEGEYSKRLSKPNRSRFSIKLIISLYKLPRSLLAISVTVLIWTCWSANASSNCCFGCCIWQGYL